MSAASIGCDEDRVPLDASGPSDATTDSDSTILDARSDVVDAARDSYVDWCEAGPPSQFFTESCYDYYFVPCGLPPGDTFDDAGVLNRCDQICLASPDDLCAVIPQVWLDVFLDAGMIDAGMENAVDAGAVFVLCQCVGGSGRRPVGLRKPKLRATNPLGAYFAHGAHLEAASIPAFTRLRDELRAFGAPRHLVRAADRASRDETRHARMMTRLATRFGAKPPAVRLRASKSRSLEALARENAIEGCVRETFGALVATWQARHATDAAIREAMETIARDETRHAELSFAIDAFCTRRLDERAALRVRRARERAMASLRRTLSSEIPRDWIRIAGFPSARESHTLLDTLEASLRDGP